MKPNNNFHILLLTIFGIIFVGTIILANTQALVDIEYDIKNEIKIRALDLHSTYNVDIGKIKVENGGIIPKKVFLPNFVVCQFSSEYGNKMYDINYLNAEMDYTNGDKETYIEISSFETNEVVLSGLVNSLNLKEINLEYLVGEEMDFYLMEMDSYENRFTYCDTVGPEDAVEKITVTFE
jgi:hypothetical protein